MIGHHAVALDVGGVAYYDEPFEPAWRQGSAHPLPTPSQV
jgi:hypothetical protein